jgi:hypothetical protein
MSQGTKTTYFILPKGATKEEARTWEEIEAMAGAGLLSADTLIFFPQENDWKPASETTLAPLFEAFHEEGAAEVALDEAAQAEYTALCEEIGHRTDWNLRVQAADLAGQLGDRDACVEHLNIALVANPYHPRLVQEAHRLLTPPERKKLRFLERPKPAWESIPQVVTFALYRGPKYPAVFAGVLAALSFVPGGLLFISPLLFIWAVEVVRSEGRIVPMPADFLKDVPTSIIRPVAVGLGLGLEVFGPFLLIAAALAAGIEDGVITVLGKSPLLLVPMAALALFYVPAAMVLAAHPAVKLKRVLDPRSVFGAIGIMEQEYLLSLALVLGTFSIWAGISVALSKVPIAGQVLSAALSVFVLFSAVEVVGRLRTRFGDHIAVGKRP